MMMTANHRHLLVVVLATASIVPAAHSSTADDRILQLTAKIEAGKDSWGSLRSSLLDLKDAAEKTPDISTRTANEVVRRLLPVFTETKEKFPRGPITVTCKADEWVPIPSTCRPIDTRGKFEWPPYYGLIEIAAKYSDSAEAAEFVAQLIDTENEPRKYIENTSYGYIARGALARSRRHAGSVRLGDSLIKSLNQGPDSVSLLALLNIDRTRARPAIKKAFETVRDKLTYHQISGIAVQSEDTELFSVMLSRMKEFGRSALVQRKHFDAYLLSVEGEDLAKALDVICSVGKFYSEEVLLKKMNSNNPVSRAAGYRTVGCMIKAQQYHGSSPTIDVVKHAVSADPDIEARAEAQVTMAEWEKRPFLH